MNTRLTEERNVLADYLGIYGKEPSLLEGMSLMVDSDQTNSHAASLFGPIAFRPEVQRVKGRQDHGTDEPQTFQQNKMLGALRMYLGLKQSGGPH